GPIPRHASLSTYIPGNAVDAMNLMASSRGSSIPLLRRKWLFGIQKAPSDQPVVPPGESPASRTTTERPAREAKTAALIPAAPEPTTITSTDRPLRAISILFISGIL